MLSRDDVGERCRPVLGPAAAGATGVITEGSGSVCASGSRTPAGAKVGTATADGGSVGGGSVGGESANGDAASATPDGSASEP